MPVVNGSVNNINLRNGQILNVSKRNIKVCVIRQYVEIEYCNLLGVWLSKEQNYDNLLDYNILCKICYIDIKNTYLYNITNNRSNISYLNFEQHNIYFYNFSDAHSNIRCSKCNLLVAVVIETDNCEKCCDIIHEFEDI